MSKLNITEDGHIQFKEPEVNIYSKPQWKVVMKHSFRDQPVIVNADNEDEAKKMAVAEYRRQAGYVNTVDFWKAEDMIISLEQIAE